MSDKSLVDVMRKYVRENRPHNGAVAEIDGKDWIFICKAKFDTLPLYPGHNFVFTHKMKITSFLNTLSLINVVFLDDVTFFEHPFWK